MDTTAPRSFCTVVRLPMLIGPPANISSSKPEFIAKAKNETTDTDHNSNSNRSYTNKNILSEGADRSNRLIRALIEKRVPVDLGGVPAIMDVRDAAQMLLELARGPVLTINQPYRVVDVKGYCVSAGALSMAVSGRRLTHVPKSITPLVMNAFKQLQRMLPRVLSTATWSGTSIEMFACDWSVPSGSNDAFHDVRPLAETLGIVVPHASTADAVNFHVPETIATTTTTTDIDVRRVLLTGSTGFVGTMILASLLRRFDNMVVFVLVRDKRGVDANARFDAHWQTSPPLQALPSTARQCVHVVQGDCNEVLLGLQDDTLATIRLHTDCVIHCAASVRFDHPLDRACMENIYPMTQLLSLFQARQHEVRLVHVSTAYVDYRRGHLSGNFRPLEHVTDMDALYNAASRAHWVPELSLFPNAYTFTKAVAEEMALRSNFRIHIVRPAIVHVALQYPWPGYSSGFGAAVGLLMSQLQSKLFPVALPGDDTREASLVPVDVVADHVADIVHDSQAAPRIQTLCGSPGPSSITMSNQVLQKYIMARQWVTVPALVKGPQFGLRCMSLVCHMVELFSSTRTRRIICSMRHGMYQLMQFAYTERTFESAPNIAQCYDNQTSRYHMLSGLIGSSERIDASQYVDALRTTTMWMSPWYPVLSVCAVVWAWMAFVGMIHAYTWVMGAVLLAYVWRCVLPMHEFRNTMLPWIAVPVALFLKSCYDRVLVVPRDFLATMRVHRHANQVTVLCCSHTSYLDFIVLPFVLYMLSPLLDIEQPRIVACSSFARMPLLGTLMRWGGVVFVKRHHDASMTDTNTNTNQSLADQLLQCILEDRASDLFSQSITATPITRGPCFLVFPSGTRSRDGVSQALARTGFFKALSHAAAAACVDEVHWVPIGITYDRRVDDAMLFGEISAQMVHRSGCGAGANDGNNTDHGLEHSIDKNATKLPTSHIANTWRTIQYVATSILRPVNHGNIVVRAGQPIVCPVPRIGECSASIIIRNKSNTNSIQLARQIHSQILAQMDVPSSIWRASSTTFGSRRLAPPSTVDIPQDTWFALRARNWKQYTTLSHMETGQATYV